MLLPEQFAIQKGTLKGARSGYTEIKKNLNKRSFL